MARLVKALPAIVGGLLLAAAFPPFDLRLMVFIALGWWIASIAELSPKGAFKSGYILGFVFLLPQFQFLQALTARWTGSVGLSIFPYLICCVLGSFYFGFIGWLIWICWDRRQPLIIPLVWAGVEVFRSYIPVFAFPYGLLPSPLWPYPMLIQAASVGMIYGVSAWIVLFNTLIAQVIRKSPYSRPGLVMFFLILGASVAISLVPVEGRSFRIAIGQPGVDMAFGNPDQNRVAINQNVTAFEAAAKQEGARLLVLPEGISEGFLPIDPDLPTLYGGQRVDGAFHYQSGFAEFRGQTTFIDKTRLVIFGEFVPGRHVIPFLDKFNLPSGDMDAGKTVDAIEMDGTRVGPVICFEGLFPDIAYHQALNGSQVLAVMSVDDWYMGTGAPEQLKSASVFRAVETGLPLVRAATQGYSFAVDQRGNGLTEAPLGKTQLLTAELKLGKPTERQVPWKFAFPLIALFCVPIVITLRILTKAKIGRLSGASEPV